MAVEPPFAKQLPTGHLKVPDHEMLKLIGRGSYGEVWLARNVMGTYRAIKVVQRDAFDNDRPYEREYEGIRKFEPISRTHDSQVDVLQVGRDDHSFYYIMELADDSSLRATSSGEVDVEHYSPKTLKSEMNRRAPLPIDECVEIGLALTTALAHLHKNELVHRDIKPSNIIYLNGLPKLADIGLVCRFDATLSHVGTIGFVAPEGPGTPESDIYSLGKVLYEAATARDRQDFPELPTQLSGTKEQQTALLELNEVLLRACEGNPRDRYQSAEEMHEDLLLLRSGKSLVRLRTAERRFKWARRVGIAALIAATIGGLAYWNQARQTRVVSKLAQEKSALAEEKGKLADEKTTLLEENRQRLARLNVANGIQAMDRGELSTALLWFAEALPLVTNRPAEEATHRIRIQQTLDHQPRLLQVLPHEANVFSGAFSPDGKRVATISKRELRIWDAASGALSIGPLKQFDWVRNVSFTRNGRQLLLRSCSDQGNAPFFPANGDVSLVNAETYRPVLSIKGVGRSVLSPNERWLAAARTNNFVELIDVETGSVLRELRGHSDLIRTLTFDAASSLLAAGGNDGTVHVWRIPSGEPLGDPITLRGQVERVAFSPDSSTIASTSLYEQNVYIQTWHFTDHQEIGSAITAGREVKALFFDPVYGDRLVANDQHGVSVLARDTHKSLLPPNRIDTRIRSWDWSPDGLFLAIGSDEGTVSIWNVETGEPITPKLVHTGYVEAVKFSFDGTRLLTTSDDGTAKIWSLTAGVDSHPPLHLKTPLPSFQPYSFVSAYALSSDGKHLIIGGSEARVINTGTLEVEAETSPQEGGAVFFGGVAIDSTGQQWAAGLGDVLEVLDDPGKLHNTTLWRREAGVVRAFILKHPQSVSFLEFTKDGSQLLTVAKDNILRRWQTSNGALIGERAIAGPPHGLPRFSPDNRTVALWSFGGEVSLFKLDANEGLSVIAPGELRANHVAFSPDGLRLATAGSDQCGHIWDVRTGRELTPPFKHGGAVAWVEWSPDGTQLLTAGTSTLIKLWNANSGEMSEGAIPISNKGSALVAHFSPNGRFVIGRGDQASTRVWDVSTCDPLTPEIRHEGFVRAAVMVGSNRVVTVSDPGIIRAWDLKASELSVAFLTTYAQLICSQKITSSGRGQPLTPAESVARMTDLRGTNAGFFAQSNAEIRRFHREHILPPFTLLELASASYHLEKLAELDPQSPELPSLRQLLDQSRIPARESDLDSSMIDLSSYYNAALTMSWHEESPGHDLAKLPRGKQILNGVTFDVRGLIQVANEVLDDLQVHDRFAFPRGIYGIELHKKAERLHFLHATQGLLVPRGEYVGSYVIRYRNGRTEEVRLIYGQDLRDWFAQPGEPEETTHAVIAWKGHNRTSLIWAKSLHLYQLAWENPAPNEEIATLDFVAGTSRAKPFLIALTVDARD